MPIGLSRITQPWTSRRSRRGWPLFCRGCLLPRGSLVARIRSSDGAPEIFFSDSARMSSIGAAMASLGVVTIIHFRPNLTGGLFAPQVFSIISRSVPLHRIDRQRGSEDQAQILS